MMIKKLLKYLCKIAFLILYFICLPIAHSQEVFLTLSQDWDENRNLKKAYDDLIEKGGLAFSYILVDGKFVGVFPAKIKLNQSEYPHRIEIGIPQISDTPLCQLTIRKDIFQENHKSIYSEFKCTVLKNEIHSFSWDKLKKNKVNIPFLVEKNPESYNLPVSQMGENEFEIYLPLQPYESYVEYVAYVKREDAQKFWPIPLVRYPDESYVKDVAYVKMEDAQVLPASFNDLFSLYTPQYQRWFIESKPEHATILLRNQQVRFGEKIVKTNDWVLSSESGIKSIVLMLENQLQMTYSDCLKITHEGQNGLHCEKKE